MGTRPGYKLLQDAHIASIMAAMIREMAQIAAKRGGVFPFFRSGFEQSPV